MSFVKQQATEMTDQGCLVEALKKSGYTPTVQEAAPIRGHRSEKDRQMRVRAQRPVRFVRTVGGSRKSVRAKSDPREKRDQRNGVEQFRVFEVSRFPEHGLLDLL